jgi:hypothetical protein
MDALQNIPLTILSNLSPPGQAQYIDSKVHIGSNVYIPLNQPRNVFWILILDRTTPNLQVVENFTFVDNHSIPPQLLKYNNDPKYLMILSTRYLFSFSIPQGSFYQYLKSQFNAGPALQRLEQIFGAATSGTNYFMSYTLVTPFDGSLEQPLEFSKTGDGIYSTYTLQLIPEDNPNGVGILYVPYSLY